MGAVTSPHGFSGSGGSSTRPRPPPPDDFGFSGADDARALGACGAEPMFPPLASGMGACFGALERALPSPPPPGFPSPFLAPRALFILGAVGGLGIAGDAPDGALPRALPGMASLGGTLALPPRFSSDDDPPFEPSVLDEEPLDMEWRTP